MKATRAMTTHKRTGNWQGGVILLEVLVAILIFSIGILAVVGLQGVAVRTSTDARFRSEAAFLAGELASQIWSDAINVSQYDYPGSGTVPVRLAGWVARVNSRLPDASSLPPIVDYTADAALGEVVDITVRWRLPGEAAGHQHQVRMNVNLNP
jgi:type IV pilus assembly protein PilV